MESQRKQFYTNFFKKNDVISTAQKCSQEYIDSFSRKMIDSSDLLNVSIADGAGYINYVAKINVWPEYMRKIFLQCFFSAEMKIKSSGNIATYFLAVRFLFGEDSFSFDNEKPSHASVDVAFRSLSKLIDPNIFSFIKETIEYTGINGKISIKQTESHVPAIELKSCHDFNIGMSDKFIEQTIQRDEVKFIVYDGAVKSVGQVDRLFNECHEHNATCVLIARQFGDDVMSTINANYKRNTLDVIPIIVGDSIENLNILSDIALVSSSNLITAESGIRLSNIGIEDSTTVHNFKANYRSMQIDQKTENQNVINKRIKNILEKIERSFFDDKMSQEDIDLVYGNRLSALEANSVTIWTRGDREFITYLNSLISFSINYIAAFANSGCINLANYNKINIKNYLPSNIVDVSNSVSKKMYTAICNSGGCVAIQ